MTIHQMIDIPPSRKVHIDLVLPRDTPSGRAELVLEFKPLDAQAGENPLDPELEKLMQEAEEKRLYNQAHPEEIRALRGSLPETAFSGMDGVSYQRRLRDEWEERLMNMGISDRKA